MRELDPKIDLQAVLHQQIYDALQGPILEDVRKLSYGVGSDVFIRSEFEGNSLKVEQSLLPDIYELCQEVLQKLEFTEPVDFYISGNSDINAFTIASEEEGMPHIVNIQSALFKLMNREELKFVIGHEIGHLINKDSALRALIRFVYPKTDKEEDDKMPGYLDSRITLYDQLAELGADRWGYMACESLDASIRAFYKLSSGLDLSNMNVSIETLIAENKKRLDFFLTQNGISDSDHPANALRIQAIYLFARAKTQKALREGMNEIIDVLWNLEELERYQALFYASAGLIVACQDGKVDNAERAKIIEEIGAFDIFPQQTLKKIEKSDVGEIFNESVNKILELEPSLRPELLSYFIKVACIDKKLTKDEVGLIYDFGQKIGFHPVQISRAIAFEVRESYVPKVL